MGRQKDSYSRKILNDAPERKTPSDRTHNVQVVSADNNQHILRKTSQYNSTDKYMDYC